MISDIKRTLMTGLEAGPMMDAIRTIAIDPKRPLGKLNPWAWWIELTRGCNLQCAFCATRLFERGEYHYMDEETWRALLTVIQEVSPRTRLEFGNAGEPTLHPRLLDFLRIAREICPRIQLLTHTNGTLLVSGELTYKQLFEAGLNSAFVDMYAPYPVHRKLAEESGYTWFHQDEKPDNAPNVFTYRDDPDSHVIMLAESPYSWSDRKAQRGHLQTFFNDLDWKAAERFQITPVTAAPKRRCDLPSKFVDINHDGTFSFCCWDFMRHTASEFGNIKNGVGDFLTYWLGRYMQDVRSKLNNKDRASHEFCSKCSFVSIRGDIPYWKGGNQQYWDGKEWQILPAYDRVEAPSGTIKMMKRTQSSRIRTQAAGPLFDVDIASLLPKG